MNATVQHPRELTGEESAILASLLDSECTKLLVEIRHTDHRAFRDELRHRLVLVEGLLNRFRPAPGE